MSDMTKTKDMQREFESREELIQYIQREFSLEHDTDVSDMIGGRSEALKRLNQVSLGRQYQKTRNFLDGAVTKLSPYIRHGILNLGELRLYALKNATNPKDVEKFINELGWRDFFQRNYVEHGNGIWHNIENYKTGFATHEYADDLPTDIIDGQTDIPFIDDIVHELKTTGYLHNHQRMWFAAYVVHWRRVKWQAGASFFLEHLLDGDPASNNLSWQWVASTFSHKPYYFNLDSLRKFTSKRYEADHSSYDIFDKSYDAIARDLFPRIDLSDSNKQQRGKRNNKRQKNKRYRR